MDFIDIHCHPTLKTWLFNKRVYNPGLDPLALPFEKMLVNLPDMQQGRVNAVVSVHYLPEAKLRTKMDNFPMKNFLNILLRRYGKTVDDIIEDDHSSPDAAFKQIQRYIQQFEKDIHDSPAHHFPDAVAATTFSDFESNISRGKTVFLHSIEGAHCLGHGKEISYKTLEEHLVELFKMGVCQFTLAHFYENILVSSQGGIPPKIRNLIGYDPANTYQKGYNERDNIAVRLVDKMLDLGIIIDLVHCPQGAKEMVYERNNRRGSSKRPLVFSHTGVRAIALKYNPDFPWRDALYLPDDDDIVKIKQCAGVLGILFMDYWLNGHEKTTPALAVIIETIQHIRQVCGDYENISVGSDLDGFTEVPSDLEGAKHMTNLTTALKRTGISDANISKICFENYCRVLKNGWGRQSLLARLGLQQLFRSVVC
jgi:microsomal dipeptidase-like Zn-dependent dipeptidase